MEELIELITLEALISWVRKHSSWKDLYAPLDKSLMKVKQVMENHKWWYEPPIFYQEFQDEKPFNQSCSPIRKNNSKKCQKMLVREHVQYLERRNTIPLNATLTKVFTAIKGKYYV